MAPVDKVTCSSCRKNINLSAQEHIFCEGDCKRVWHVPKCIQIESKEYQEIVSDPDKSWFCVRCRKQRQTRREQRRSVLLNCSADQLITTPSASDQHSTASSIKSTNKNIEIDNRKITLPIIYDKLLELSTKYNTIERAIDDVKKTIEDYKRLTDSLIDDNEELRNENTALKERVNNIEYNVDKILQEKLLNNIVINGIQSTENEKPEEYVEKIAEKMQVTLNANDIKTIFRKKTSSKYSNLPPSIIVQFHSSKKRDEFMQKKKDVRLSTTIFGKDEIARSDIYISEQLTNRRQFIMKMARELKRDKKIEFAWSKYGEIFIRRKTGSSAIKIKHSEQLNKFIHDNT